MKQPQGRCSTHVEIMPRGPRRMMARGSLRVRMGDGDREEEEAEEEEEGEERGRRMGGVEQKEE